MRPDDRSEIPPPLRFGRFELQSHERRLLVDGAPAALGGRAFDVLAVLAGRAGTLVSKHELLDLVWPGLVVEENNLAAQVSALRKVVGDGVVATVPGRGYRFVARIDDDAPAPAAAHAAPPPALRTNLPAALPPLLGRADDLAALGALVDAHRLVALVGPGGIGKSLLARHLLDGRRAAYPQGVCWVELGAVGDAGAVAGAIAAALGVEVGRGEPVGALAAAVAPLAMLLALDNAEHLLDAVARLAEALLAHAPRLRLLVTSQAPLRLAGERVFRLGPLALPPAPLLAAATLEFGAPALFVERAQAVDRRFALTDANAAAVVDVCRGLDGLPLAIELAAARAPLLGVQPLLASLRDRFAVLTKGRDRTAPARQQTLRAALDWSHGLLAPAEQAVFRRLGVVADSAALELAAAVAADPPALAGWAVVDALDALVERSLVAVVAGDEQDGAPGYRLLESARAYALERLDAAGERAAVERRHAEAMAVLLDRAYDDCFGGAVGADAWLRRLGRNLDDARAALAWARRTGDAAIRVAVGATLLRALPASLHAERMALADDCEGTVDGPAVPPRLRQRAWIELSGAWADTQKQRSRDAADRAVDLARALAGDGARFALYLALCRAASAAAQCGDVEAARAPLAEAQAIEDPAWPAQRLLWGAEAAQVVARVAGDRAAALALGRRLLALDRARGGDASIALGNLIDAELAAGDAAAAARTGSDLVAALQGTRNEYSLAFARLNLCAAWLALDDAAQARAVAEAAWPQALAFDLQHVAAVYAALLAALERRPRAAARLLGYAEAIYGARAEAIEANEAAAAARARALAVAALGEAGVGAAHAAGAGLGDADAGALVFARVDDEPKGAGRP